MLPLTLPLPNELLRLALPNELLLRLALPNELLLRLPLPNELLRLALPNELLLRLALPNDMVPLFIIGGRCAVPNWVRLLGLPL